MIIPAIKVIYMILMFAVFALGILLEFLLALPVLYIIDKSFGKEPERMQRVHRFFFSIWTFLMAAGLLKYRGQSGKICEGPCVIIANHPGLFDVIYLIYNIPRMSLMVKRSLAQKLPLGGIFRLSGYVVSPDINSESPVKSLQEAIDKLRMGYKFLIFPEGTRSPGGKLRPFKAGAFKIAQKLSIPVQPVLIKNTPPFIPKERPWYLLPQKRSHIEIEFWSPLLIPPGDDPRMAASRIEEKYRTALGL